MIRINLLPIREEARQRDLKQQLMLLVLLVIAQILALSMWYASAADVLDGRQAELRIAQSRPCTGDDAASAQHPEPSLVNRNVFLSHRAASRAARSGG